MNRSSDIVVKIIGSRGPLKEPSWRMLRQFPGRIPRWGNCRFLFGDEEDYDWLVIYDGFRGELPCHCPQENTLLITGEPASIKTYGKAFLRQFGYVLTGQEDWALQHPGKIFSQPALFWYYGGSPVHGKDYDEMLAHPPEDKTELIATVCSGKQQKHTLHYQRYHFTQELKKRIPEIDHFGREVREMQDKSEALDPYQYHIAIENHQAPHWWTEKISDAFLGLTLPFYYGAPNLSDYFPEESYIPIDIFDIEGSAEIIKAAIINDEYHKRLPAIRKARELVLNQYNLFAVLDRIITERHVPGRPVQPGATLLGRHEFRRSLSGKMTSLAEKIQWKINCARHRKR